MPLNKVPIEAITEHQRPLEVDATAGLIVTDDRSRERLAHGFDTKRL
jgi:hypothetical protein